MSKAEIGAMVKERRISLGLKQEDLAEMAGISAKTIYLLERGRGNAAFDTLEKIFNVLGLVILVQVKSVEG